MIRKAHHVKHPPLLKLLSRPEYEGSACRFSERFVTTNSARPEFRNQEQEVLQWQELVVNSSFDELCGRYYDDPPSIGISLPGLTSEEKQRLANSLRTANAAVAAMLADLEKGAK